ncbi:MAG: hypothetical protein KCHDKBKB_00678 [Elusimicrobia bacterium]|nr:hypothetical protein [Elusimicrobiota bacterium]
MSTCNFSLPSTAPRHYTIGVNEELESWQFDDAIANVASDLAKIEPKIHYDDDGYHGRDVQRICRWDLPIYDKESKDWDRVSIYAIVESGYYQGAMFDIDLQEVEDIKLNKTLQNRVDKIKRQIEAVYARHTYQIVRVAVFSNGEGWYQPASDRSILKAVATGQVK